MQNYSVDRSSYQNKNEDEENEVETEKEESLIRGDSEFDLAMKLPVKLHIYKIEVNLPFSRTRELSMSIFFS